MQILSSPIVSTTLGQFAPASYSTFSTWTEACAMFGGPASDLLPCFLPMLQDWPCTSLSPRSRSIEILTAKNFQSILVKAAYASTLIVEDFAGTEQVSIIHRHACRHNSTLPDRTTRARACLVVSRCMALTLSVSSTMQLASISEREQADHHGSHEATCITTFCIHSQTCAHHSLRLQVCLCHPHSLLLFTTPILSITTHQ